MKKLTISSSALVQQAHDFVYQEEDTADHVLGNTVTAEGFDDIWARLRAVDFGTLAKVAAASS